MCRSVYCDCAYEFPVVSSPRMGICGSMIPEKDEKAILTKKIDLEMKMDQKKNEGVVKLLLLGPGESGKSTILKQMRIIHQNGFSDAEMVNRKAAVYFNLLQACMQLLDGLRILHYELNDDRQKDTELVMRSVMHSRLATEHSDEFDMNKMRIEEHHMPSQDICNAIERLWSDKTVQAAYERRSEFQLNDSAEYFFNSVGRICQPDYFPTQLDILMTRVPTTGVQEICYAFKETNFRIFDVGGQKSERRKWIHCFDDVNALVFVVAMSEYDQVLREDGETNRMHDSLYLFKDTINSMFFQNSQVILFLNKKDLFAEKIKKISISVAFHKYKGSMDYTSTSTYICTCFERLKKDPEKLIYSHFTCATDTDQVQLVLNSTTDMIISKNFQQTGVM